MSKPWRPEYLVKYSSIPTSLWITLMFVLSLYLWPKHRGNRQSPSTIIRRSISIIISTCISIMIVYFYSRYHSNKSWIELLLCFRLHKLKIKDIVWPIIVTGTIFIGPLVDDLISKRVVQVWRNRPHISLILRNFVIGPVVEEIVFRCINCTLLAHDFPTSTNILVSGLLFGAAHLHPQIMQHVFLDVERQLIVDSIWQFLYTSAFGIYVASIFMKTRSLWPAAAVHIFCNLMGAPTSNIVKTGWIRLITTTGIAGWLILYTNYLMSEG